MLDTAKEAIVKAAAPRPCSETIPIVPSRYALMPKEIGDKTKEYYKDCPTDLDTGFMPLKTAAYSVRTLRPGYVYAYDEVLDTTNVWESDGQGNYTSLKFNNLEEYNKASNFGSKAQCINLDVSKDSTFVYLIYSQDLWTKKGIMDNIAQRDKFMMKFDVLEFLNGSKAHSTQQHILPSDTPEQWIEEYKVEKKDYAQQFNWSCNKVGTVATANTVPMSNLKALATKYDEDKKSKLPVFMVLYDNLAIARDQGLIAALHLRQLASIKDPQTSKEVKSLTPAEVQKIPSEMLLNTEKLNKKSIEFYRKKMIAEMINSIMQSSYPSPEDLKAQKKPVTTLKQQIELEKIQIDEKLNGRHRVVSASERKVGIKEATVHALSNEKINANVGKFTKHIDMKELLSFTNTLDEENAKIEAILDKALIATADHANILKTMKASIASNPRYLKATLDTYDSENSYSATAFETAAAYAIQGMGVPVPGKAEVDERIKLLDEWVEDPSSPLFMGLSAFAPFKDKIDSVADIMGGGGDFLTETHKLFPYAIGTNIITTEIATHAYRKMHGETRWSKSKTLVENVSEAIKSKNLEKLMVLIQARYKIIGTEIEKSVVTQKYWRFIDKATDTKYNFDIDGKGPRSTKIIEKTITKTGSEVKSVSEVLKFLNNQTLSTGVALFHGINLLSAAGSFARDDSAGNSLNLGSAIFGFAGAFSTLLEKTTEKEVLERTAQRTSTGLSAKVVSSKMILAVTSTLATKVFGFGGALFEAGYHFYKGLSLSSSGDTDSSIYSFAASATLGAGGVILTMAATGGLAASAIPVAGWVIGAILLTGVGIYMVYKSITSTDSPLEVWVSRTVFGIRRRTTFMKQMVETPFQDLSEELAGYYNVAFGPRLIENPDRKLFLTEDEIKMLNYNPAPGSRPLLPDEMTEEQRQKALERYDTREKYRDIDADTDWDGNFLGKDEAKFTFLLPAYKEGISRWDHKFNSYDEDGIKNDKDEKTATKLGDNLRADKEHESLKKEGKYIYLSKILQNRAVESVRLIVNYWPNGFNEDPATQIFYMDE